MIYNSKTLVHSHTQDFIELEFTVKRRIKKEQRIIVSLL
ncbi:MAG: hypothetical protein ACI9V1_002538 [Spirosomataceae bacterium]|jgi:hypothetical protein